MNEDGITRNIDMVDNNSEESELNEKTLEDKVLGDNSFQGIRKDIPELEVIQIKSNVDNQLTSSENQASANAEAIFHNTSVKRSSPISYNKEQGKSILENCLTRPLSTPFHSGSHYNIMDNRKVEPLKINLHREPIKTVIKIPPSSNTEPQQQQQQQSPKITIKPLKPPTTLEGTSESESDSHSHKPHSKSFHESVESLKNNVESHNEAHIVPKLTIRNISHQTPTSTLSTTSSESSNHSESFHAVVPKLTIKIDHQTTQDSYQQTKTHEKKIRQDEGMLTADGVKLTIKPIVEPPIPKLTIKTTSSDGSITSVNRDAVHQPIPKLLIKPIHSEMPKKDVHSGSDENDSNENSVEAPVESTPIPKLTLKTNSVEQIIKPESTLTPTVPKLILKMDGKKIVCGDDLSDTSTNEPIEESDCPTSEKSSPEQRKLSSKTNDKSILTIESDQIVSLVEDSESNLEINDIDDDLSPEASPPDHSISLKPQLEMKASTIVHQNPDSPRIILKINKANSCEVKSVSEPSTTKNAQKDSNSHTIDLSTKVSKQKTTMQADTTAEVSLQENDAEMSIESTSIKRSLDANDSIDDNEVKKMKFSNLQESPNKTISTDPENSPMECTIISDEDDNDRKSDMSPSEQPAETMENTCEETSEQKTDKLIDETISITIDDDSSSLEKPKDEDVILNNIDTNNTIETVANTQPCTDATPIKRGRGRPKKIVQLTSTKSTKENDSSQKDASFTENSMEQKNDKNTSITKTPSRGRGRGRGRGGKTVEIVKDGKVLQVKMDAGYEDDDSPTFSIYNRYVSSRGRGRGGRGKRGLGRMRKSLSNEGTQNNADPNKTSNNLADLKVSLQKLPQKLNNSGSLQIFEEDTLMGGDIFQTPFRNLPDFPDESQSSQLSSASATNEGRERKRGKMEVCEPEGRTEFTVDMLAEYEWPQKNKYGQKPRNSEMYMIQEQISEYLGIKSFKRKYPDLVRRPVEMEERNYIMENCLVSEKMCDLGLTAVVLQEILDIMCNDYPEKYEEYTRYQREKRFLEFSRRQKLLRFDQENKGQHQKDKAIETAAAWNATFNKERIQMRKSCIDLQTLVIQIPKLKSDQIVAQNEKVTKKTNYPISLVPGQFSEFFKSYSAEELACYPINTVLIHHSKLEALLKEQEEYNEISLESDSSESGSESDDSSASDSDSLDSSSSCDEKENIDDDSDPLCAVCDLTQYKNTYGHPEIFIECTACHRKAHPTCIKMSLKMVKRAIEYNWKCAECKNCSKCMRTTDETKMLFCSRCDRGYHIYCLGLRNVPEGHWYCNICTICTKCGTKNPEGNPNPLLTPNQRQNLAMVANWTHLYRTNNITKLREHYQTLCVPCAKLQNS